MKLADVLPPNINAEEIHMLTFEAGMATLNAYHKFIGKISDKIGHADVSEEFIIIISAMFFNAGFAQMMKFLSEEDIAMAKAFSAALDGLNKRIEQGINPNH